MEKYANYANKMISDFSFYETAFKSLGEKIRKFYDEANVECAEQEDKCLKRDLAQIAIDLSNISQLIGFNELIDITDFCGALLETHINTIEIDPMFLNLEKNEVKTLTYKTKNPNNEEIFVNVGEWHSEDPSVATVDQNGNVKGINIGNTRIYVQYCELKEYCPVVVSGEQEYYCDVLRGNYSGRFSIYGFQKHSDGGSHKMKATAKVHLNCDAGKYTCQFERYFRVRVMKYQNGGYVFDYEYTEYTKSHLGFFREDNAVDCDNNGYYGISDYKIGDITLYPEAGYIRIENMTFFDKYLSSTGTLYQRE